MLIGGRAQGHIQIEIQKWLATVVSSLLVGPRETSASASIVLNQDVATAIGCLSDEKLNVLFLGLVLDADFQFLHLAHCFVDSREVLFDVRREKLGPLLRSDPVQGSAGFYCLEPRGRAQDLTFEPVGSVAAVLDKLTYFSVDQFRIYAAGVCMAFFELRLDVGLALFGYVRSIRFYLSPEYFFHQFGLRLDPACTRCLSAVVLHLVVVVLVSKSAQVL